jgi:hypothetical protein
MRRSNAVKDRNSNSRVKALAIETQTSPRMRGLSSPRAGMNHTIEKREEKMAPQRKFTLDWGTAS